MNDPTGVVINDVAVIKLNSSSSIQPIEFLTSKEQEKLLLPSSTTTLTVMGWGKIDNSALVPYAGER